MNYILLVLLTGFQGIDSITSVKWVEVGVGQTLTIPCHYDARYSSCNEVFARFLWNYWRTIVDSTSYSLFLMSDDPTQRLFTVTMKNMKQTDTGWYRCGCEGSVYHGVYISVTDSPRLYVGSQYVTGHVGGSVDIYCNYNRVYGEKKWCRIDGHCAGGNYNYISGLSVEMSGSDSYVRIGVLNVTLRHLQESNTGWYYCSVGDLQVSVHITVTQNTTTQETSTMPTGNTPTPKTINTGRH
ncbi:hypothetical protein ACEWY4_019048 [Coilia grayii]|uniref:Immunoglobulin domain-containing protein n=1 Tax=Coilia grayii TaxID=363190 RepID=A0ABD1JI86_9TELE